MVVLRKKKPTEPNFDFTEQLHTIAQQLQAQVKLKPGKAGKGSLVIHYNDQASLEQILTKLK